MLCQISDPGFGLTDYSGEAAAEKFDKAWDHNHRYLATFPDALQEELFEQVCDNQDPHILKELSDILKAIQGIADSSPKDMAGRLIAPEYVKKVDELMNYISAEKTRRES